jgi:branched-chain amino acid transport system ATP-binding protein
MSAGPLLELRDVEAVYDHVVLALHGVTLAVEPGAIVALLGANGAGKTTTLLAASGLLAAEKGAITRGEIRYRGEAVTHVAPRALVRRGVVQVLEGRHCFAHLSIEDNLITGALARRPSRAALRADLDRIYAYFPALVALRRKPAGYASGGEQQMVAIARALLARPTLVLLDEPSMGLAPQIVHAIFEIVARLRRDEGTSFLVAEQNARVALRYADHAYVLENGRVVTGGAAAELAARDDVKELYLGSGRRAAPLRREASP